MADFYWLDRVQETTMSTGIGDLVLAGATQRMIGIGDAGIANGGGFLALIEHQAEGKNEWELVPCTYNSAGAGSISRGTPRKSSLGTSNVPFTSGVKTVSIVEIAGVRVYSGRTVTSGISTKLLATDCMLVLNKSVGAAHAVELPDEDDLLPYQSVTIFDGKGDADANPITVTSADTAVSIAISAAWESREFIWTGSQWLVR